jgi:hypothetical protein
MNLWKKDINVSPQRAYLFISIPIISIISWSVFIHPIHTTHYGFDFWEHSALIREWTKNLWHPGNPHLAINTGSPRYMPLFFLVTVLAKMFDLNPIQALGIGGVMTMILFVWGGWLFLGLYFKNDWAPFIGLIVLLCGWGAGWYWSNCYQLRCLFYTITYPSTFVFSLSFLSFWLATKMLRQVESTIWSFFSIGIISALMLLSHPLTGTFSIGSLCLLALFESDVSFSHRCKVIGVVLAGALAAELWPYFSVWRIILGTSDGKAASWVNPDNVVVSYSRIKMLYHTHPFLNPKQFFITIGPGLFGIPALIYLAYKREHLFIVTGFMLMSLPFVANLFLTIPLGHRFLFYMIFYLHLALVWGILRMQNEISEKTQQGIFARSAKIKRGLIFSFLGICLLWNVVLSAMELLDYGVTPNLWFGRMRREPIVKEMRHLSLFIPDDAIVMAPIELSWLLPTFTGKVVAILHDNPMVADEYRRRKDTEKFFQIETTQEIRLNILRRYKATHILYKEREIVRGKNVPQLLRDRLTDFGSVAGKIDGYVIIKLRNYL